MFLLFIYQVLATEFDYTKTYLVSNSKFANLFINIASDNEHFLISPEKKTKISFEFFPKKNGAIVKANGMPICPTENEIKLCKGGETPKLIRMKEKKDGFRFKTADPKVLEIKKCFGIINNRLSFTDCQIESNDKIWYFKDFNTEIQNNFTQFGQGQNQYSFRNGNSDSSDQNFNQSSVENFNRSISQTNPCGSKQEMMMQSQQPASLYPYLTCMPEYGEMKSNNQLPMPNGNMPAPPGVFFCIPPNSYQQSPPAVPQFKKTKIFDMPSQTVVPIPEQVVKNFNQSKPNNCLPTIIPQASVSLPVVSQPILSQPTNILYNSSLNTVPSKQDCDLKASVEMSNTNTPSGNCLTYNDFTANAQQSF